MFGKFADNVIMKFTLVKLQAYTGQTALLL